MPDDPFEECFREIHDKLYARVAELYPAALDGAAFTWAKENQRALYDTWAQVAGEMDDLWKKSDTDTFRKSVYAWAKEVLAIYGAYDKAKLKDKTETETPPPSSEYVNKGQAGESKQESFL